MGGSKRQIVLKSAEAYASANPDSRLLEYTQHMETVEHQEGSNPHYRQIAEEHKLAKYLRNLFQLQIEPPKVQIIPGLLLAPGWIQLSLSDRVIRRLRYPHPRFQPLLVLGQTVQTETGPQAKQDECNSSKNSA